MGIKKTNLNDKLHITTLISVFKIRYSDQKLQYFGILLLLVNMIWSNVMHSQSNKEASETMINMYCGACHLAPNPNDLPRRLWKENVLPAMGSYYGIKKEGFGLLKKMKAGEIEAINHLNIYPENQIISNDIWQMIENYFINNSSEAITIPEDRKKRSKNLKLFKRKDFDLLGLPGSLITTLKYDESKNKLWIGEDRAMGYSWSLKKGVENKTTSSSTVSSIAITPDSLFLLEIGSLLPTELSNGAITMTVGANKSTIINELHRPVHLNVEDLNEDGKDEIIVCNFGNKTGSLCLYEMKNERFKKTIIHKQAGAIKSFVSDMNNDGLKDIVAMFSQGDESIYIFFQKDNLKFEKKKVLRFNPLFGSNDFVLVDYDLDGDLDIITAQGDNADISVTPKPYHGIRIFLNTNNSFEEVYFYPIYGATKVLADDFDQDGDIDLVATAFYQDYVNLPNEGLVYLENLDSKNYNFQSFTLNNSDPIKSYTLEKGDIDNDGDQDILLGLFSFPITKVPKPLHKLWNEAPYDLIVLFNKTN